MHPSYIFDVQSYLQLKNLSNEGNHGNVRLDKEKVGVHPRTVYVKIPPNLEFINISNINVRLTSLSWDSIIRGGQHFPVLDMGNIPFDGCSGYMSGLPNIEVFNFSGSSLVMSLDEII